MIFNALNFLLYSTEVNWPMTLPTVQKVKIRFKLPTSIPVVMLMSNSIGPKEIKNMAKINIERKLGNSIK